MTQGEAQAGPVAKLPGAAANLEQAQPEGVKCIGSTRSAPSQRRAESSSQEAAAWSRKRTWFGPEAVLAETVGAGSDFQFLDSVLAVAAGDEPLLEGLGRVDPGGEDEAGVRLLGQRFGLDDDAPAVGNLMRVAGGLAASG